MTDYTYVNVAAERVLARARAAADRVGRDMPRVIAVTKSATDDEVLALMSAGVVSEVAENRVQCLTARRTLLTDRGHSPVYHLIGSLQTNKVKYVVGACALIQSLDSMKLAAEIERQAAVRGIVQDCLVEINSGREEAKGGIMPEEAESFVRAMTAYPHIRVRGLMTMAPVTPTPEGVRPYFRMTHEIFTSLCDMHLFGDDPILSMGMSGSFEVAIEEGATMVRVGRAFFDENE